MAQSACGMPERHPDLFPIAADTEAGGPRVLKPHEVPVHLRDVAVLTVGPGSYAEDTAWPVEVGIAFCGGTPGATWLVEPEHRWTPCVPGARCWPVSGLGTGLPGGLVAEQLREAVWKHRVFSRDWKPAAAWVRRLFSVCSVEGTVEVQDLRSLIMSSRSPSGELAIADLEWADQQALLLTPDLPRVALHAVRDAATLLLLSGVTGER